MCEGDDAARQQLVEANTRLVVAIARRYEARCHLLTLEDLIQEGNIGLLVAAAKFDPARGTRFSTVAVWWIRQAIIRAIQSTDRTIRLPVHIEIQISKLHQNQNLLTARLKREPSLSELAAETDLHLSEVERLLAINQQLANPTSLDALINPQDPSSLSLLDTIAANESNSNLLPEEIIERHHFSQQLYSELTSLLSPRQLKVIALRFGLVGIALGSGVTPIPQSLEQIGLQMGISRERVRQIQNSALAILQVSPVLQQIQAAITGSKLVTLSTHTLAKVDTATPDRNKTKSKNSHKYKSHTPRGVVVRNKRSHC